MDLRAQVGPGFDYAEYGPIDEQGRSQGGARPAEFPRRSRLTLDGARTARIKAVDRDGKPLAGVGFVPWLLQKDGRRSQVNLSSRIIDRDDRPRRRRHVRLAAGDRRTSSFWPHAEGYAHRRVVVEEGETGPVTAS